MKKLIALLLACLMIVTMFAACGTKENEPSEPSTETPASSENPSEETSEQPSSEQQSEPEETGPRIVEAGTLNKHENGWYQNLDNGTDGVYFNLWANDIPADETWAVRYTTKRMQLTSGCFPSWRSLRVSSARPSNPAAAC